MKIFFTLISVYCFLMTHAEIVDGYYITKAGDTVRGKIDLPVIKNTNFIRYIRKMDGLENDVPDESPEIDYGKLTFDFQFVDENGKAKKVDRLKVKGLWFTSLENGTASKASFQGENSYSEFYKKNKEQLHEIVSLYKRTTEHMYYFMRINYGVFAKEVLIHPAYNDTIIPIIRYNKDKEQLDRFISKSDINPDDLNLLIQKMKKIKCEEIYKGFYEYDSAINNYHKTSVAIIYKEDSVLKGYCFFQDSKDYPSSAFENLKKVDKNVYYFETRKSIFE